MTRPVRAESIRAGMVLDLGGEPLTVLSIPTLNTDCRTLHVSTRDRWDRDGWITLNRTDTIEVF